MNGFLLDTNTVSELVSLKPNQQVLDWMEAADENRLYLSAMTLAKFDKAWRRSLKVRNEPGWSLGLK